MVTSELKEGSVSKVRLKLSKQSAIEDGRQCLLTGIKWFLSKSEPSVTKACFCINNSVHYDTTAALYSMLQSMAISA